MSNSLIGYGNLTVLSLSRNNIGYISLAVFIHTSRLKELDLSDNKIESIEEDTFNTLLELEKLDLRRNNILRYDSSVFQVFQNCTMINNSVEINACR